MFMKTSELICTWPKFTKYKGTILYKEAAIDKNEGTNMYVATTYENY